MMSEQQMNLRLTAKEEEIMNLFWDMGEKFVRELLGFYEDPKPHFNTLSTIVRGLEEKGFLAHNAYGTTYRYYPVVSREEFNRKTLKGVIRKYFNNSIYSAVSALVSEEKITGDDLRKLIAQVEENNLIDKNNPAPPKK
ncbi:MAG: BlaI/MecI/CopY family transcriptional regulator [Bacteroidales bacterium]